jgi:S-formylglutathione hydrolase FrmB
MKLGVVLLRIALASVLALCRRTAAHAKAVAAEYLMVPSGRMGRDIPVAFLAGGPHAVVLLAVRALSQFMMSRTLVFSLPLSNAAPAFSMCRRQCASARSPSRARTRSTRRR